MKEMGTLEEYLSECDFELEREICFAPKGK